MRKNHHGKKDRLVKRVFALCLALAVICTCLVPVFATEGLIDPQVNQEASRPVDDGEASYPDDEFAGFGEEEATRPVDGGEAAGFGEDEVATRPVEGGEDNLDGGPTVKETEWGTVIEYDTSTSTSTSTDTSSSTETQWSGEDDVVEKPDDKVVVSGDEIKKLQDMVVYRFWLRELNALDLQDITAQAQINNMTESEYLARNGEVLWNLYFIQAVPRAETIADYSSYIKNPSSNRDPKGELRQFDYWYTLDEFGNRVRLNLTDPTSNILDDKTTTVNVYAAWKDGTVGSDEEEDVDHEDLVDKNPVPVDLTAKASASYEDEDGNTKKVNLPVEVKNLPSAADHLNVIHMGDDDMQTFYESHEDSFGEMMPILGLKISPMNIKGEKVQLANGQKATVTVSGLNKLPEIAAMEEEGALTADALKVLHLKDDRTVETLDVVSYEDGTLTFETTSFSPFVLALAGGYDVETLKEDRTITIQVGETRTLTATENTSGTWKIKNDNGNITLRSDGGNKATIYGNAAGSATVTYSYKSYLISHTYTFKVTIEAGGTVPATIYNLLIPGTSPDTIAMSAWGWGIVGAKVDTSDIPWVSSTENENIGVYSRDIASNENLTSKITLPNNGAWVDRTDDAGNTVKAWRMPLATQGHKWTQHKPNDWDSENWPYTGAVNIVDQILEEYTSEIRKKNDWPDTWQLTQDDIEAVYLIPYKISKNNGIVGKGENRIENTHIDCVIQVDLKGYYTAEFYVQNTETDAYELKNTKLYKHDESVLEFNGNSIEGLQKDNYTFDGWYVEDSTGNAPNLEKEKVKFNYTPSTELSDTDRVVKFYAKYVRNTQQLTVSKTVTGLLGDTGKTFTFQLKDAKGNAVTIDNADGTAITTAGDATWTGTDGKFTLKHGDTITFNKLPVGTYYVYELDEEGALKHYQTTWTGADTEQTTPIEENAERKATVTVGADGAKALAFTNHCTLFPDTGVLLDTLPYIVILAVVAGGVALLMLRKHRKEDD